MEGCYREGDPPYTNTSREHGKVPSCMGRPHYHPPTCRICGRHRDEAGPISQTGKCRDCWLPRFEDNLDDLRSRSGPWFDHWRQRMAACVGATLDDPPVTA